MSRAGLNFTIFIAVAFLFLTPPASATVSVNVPLGNWSYGAIDKLKSLGLIQSDMRSTRPWTRLVMARLIVEAEKNFQKLSSSEEEGESNERNEIIKAILQRLEDEFKASIDEVTSGSGASTYIKPIEDLYFHYYYGSNDFDLENDKGQKLAEDSNVRVGFSSYGALWSHLAYYLNPEYRYSDGQFGGHDQEVKMFEGYGKLEFYNVEVEAGRDTMWWGTGRHGTMILTDNAQPFQLIKLSNPEPVVLPWIFKYLGLFKFTAFWTELERNRAVPHTQFMGFRLDLKPAPFLELGASRTYLLGGRGSGVKGITDLNLSDWGKILFEGNASGSLDVDQISGLDGILFLDNLDQWLRVLKSIEIWGEYYGEDEAGNWIADIGYVVGIKFGDLLLKGRSDLIFEYADDVDPDEPLVWYNNSIYRSGYRYKGEVMGHNMDTEARDYFVRLVNYLTPDLILGLDYNRQERLVHQSDREDIDRADIDLTWQGIDSLRIETGYRFQTTDYPKGAGENGQDTHIVWVFVDYSF